jgi:excisionase family DNA binding protein
MGQTPQSSNKMHKPQGLSENTTVPHGGSLSHSLSHLNLRPLVDIGEVARLLSVSVITVRRKVTAGELPFIRFKKGGPLRFDLRDVEHFIEEHRGWGE